jgi:hypothetical protein
MSKKGDLTAVPGNESTGLDVEFIETERKPEKNLGGRPTIFNKELAWEICEDIIDGRSLRSICREDGMPGLSTVFKWLDEDPWFLEQYTRAKDNQADTNTEDIQDLAKRVVSGEVEPQAARVAIEAYKWTASKLKPKKYGDKIDMTTNGKDMPTPILGQVVLKDTNHDVIDLE